MAPASSKEFLDIQANYRVWIHSATRGDMIITYSPYFLKLREQFVKSRSIHEIFSGFLNQVFGDTRFFTFFVSQINFLLMWLKNNLYFWQVFNKSYKSLSVLVNFLLFTIYLTYLLARMVLSTVLKISSFIISPFFISSTCRIFIVLLFLTCTHVLFNDKFLASKSFIKNYVNSIDLLTI